MWCPILNKFINFARYAAADEGLLKKHKNDLFDDECFRDTVLLIIQL